MRTARNPVPDLRLLSPETAAVDAPAERPGGEGEGCIEGNYCTTVHVKCLVQDEFMSELDVQVQLVYIQQR